ncbi:MAG: hypothetical protein ACYTGW_12025 [Planctomycetota bacterium]|jgi:sodium-dependent phosphate cotransporter
MDSAPGPLVRAEQPRYATWVKVFWVFFFLFVFLVGIGGMGKSFKLMGGSWMEQLLQQSRGPFCSLMIGILGTTLVQSSSMTTSVLVGMVGAQILPMEQATFMVMGANIGTTVTNTLVSLGHITRSREYQRAFAAATVHDFFNVLTLMIIFPLEVWTGFLSTSADWLGQFGGGGMEKFSGPVKTLTKPLVGWLAWMVGNSGAALLVVSIVLLFGGLIMMVRTLKSLMLEKLSNLFDRVLFKTPRRSLFLGIFLTFLVQSSSISTSVAVPLVGAGIIAIRQVFPYTMGANIGTTLTAVLATAGVADPILGVRLAFRHILFNVLGVVLFWKFRWLPIWIAEKFAELAIRNKLIPLIYIVVVFYLLPAAIIFLLC